MNLLRKPRLTVPFKAIRVPQYTSLGSDTILYFDRYGECLCAECATLERFRTQVDSGAFWEGDLEHCRECNVEIESSYGPVQE